MKKLVYLTVALGLVSFGLLTGCKKQSEEPAVPSVKPSTNAPAAPSAKSVETPSPSAIPQKPTSQNTQPSQTNNVPRPGYAPGN